MFKRQTKFLVVYHSFECVANRLQAMHNIQTLYEIKLNEHSIGPYLFKGEFKLPKLIAV